MSNAKINERVEGLHATGDTFVVSSCVEETKLIVTCTVAVDNPFKGLTQGVREWEFTVLLTVDETGLIQEIGESNFEPQGEVDETRADAYIVWVRANKGELFEEINSQLWGSAPLKRTGAEIGRDQIAAAQEFAAQYEG